jgi:hypothetical protein
MKASRFLHHGWEARIQYAGRDAQGPLRCSTLRRRTLSPAFKSTST